MEEKKQMSLEEFKKAAVIYYLGEESDWRDALENSNDVYVRRIVEESEWYMEEGWEPKVMVQAMVACLV